MTNTPIDKQYMMTKIGEEPCTLCKMPMYHNKCKIKCLYCGYTRDCSDS